MFCTHCGAKNEDGNRFCISCGALLTQPEPVPTSIDAPAPVVEEPAPAPVAAVEEPAPVAEEPAPAPVVAAPAAPVYQQPAPAYQPAPVYQPAPAYQAPAAPAAPVAKARPLIGVIVMCGIAMMLQFIYLVDALANKYIDGSGYNSAFYFLSIFTVLALFLVSAILPNWKLRSILGGIGTLTLSINVLLLSINEFQYVAEVADYGSDYALYMLESVLAGTLMVLAFIFFLIGGILAFIRFKGKGLRVAGSVLFLIAEVSDFFFYLINAAIDDYSIRFITVIIYFACIMTAVAAISFSANSRRPA